MKRSFPKRIGQATGWDLLLVVLLGAGCGGGSSPPGSGPASLTERPNIIVYLVDTLRPDHLGIYGRTPSISPNIDAFGGAATVFERAVASSPWTRSSVASLFTGLEPHRHGVNTRDDAVPPDAVTLAELLSVRGYQTVAVISNGNIAPEFGFDQGFDEYIHVRPPDNLSHEVNEEVFQFLESGRLREPFFLYVHTIDPHAPYSPRMADNDALDLEWTVLGTMDVLREFHNGRRTPSTQEKKAVVALYDAEVTDNDRSFGEFLGKLRQRDLYDASVIVFVADHGEEFWEHDRWGHGHTLYREVLDVPFIIKRPGQKTGDRDPRLAQLIDLMPTALDYAGLAIPEYLNGSSLRDPADTASPVEPQPAYSLMDLDGRMAASVTLPDYKLIAFRSGVKEGRSEVFRYATDRFESADLSASDPAITRYLTALLEGIEDLSGEAHEPVPVSPDEELLEELKALGYLQ